MDDCVFDNSEEMTLEQCVLQFPECSSARKQFYEMKQEFAFVESSQRVNRMMMWFNLIAFCIYAIALILSIPFGVHGIVVLVGSITGFIIASVFNTIMWALA